MRAGDERMTAIKRLFYIVITICLLLPVPALAEGRVGVFTVGSTEYLVDGQAGYMDVAPFIQDGRTFVPVRYAAAVMGVPEENIAFNNGLITLTEGSKVVELRSGSNLMTVNGVNIKMDVNVLIVEGRTMLPVRWVGLALGADVAWDGSSRTVTIAESGYYPGGIKSSAKMPPVTYTPSETEKKDYNWAYSGKYYTWRVEIPVKLLDYDREINKLVDGFYDSNGYEQQRILSMVSGDEKEIILSLTTSGNYAAWSEEDANYQYAGLLAEMLAEQAVRDGYDYWQTAEFVQSFVGGAIPYVFTEKPLLPAETLVDSGDCKDKSILMAAILRNMGYKVALLFFPPPAGQTVGHMAVGIAFSGDQLPRGRQLSYYTSGGTKYYFAETTQPNWRLGEISDSELEKKGVVYPVK